MVHWLMGMAMSRRLAVDFGTSNTILAFWDTEVQQPQVLHLPDYGRQQESEGGVISYIPSVIHYSSEQDYWIGQQVFERGLYASPYTVRWMKRYISHRSPLRLRVGQRDIHPADAGRDFLRTVLFFALEELHPDEEVGFSVPVEAFEHYENWLLALAEELGIRRFRVIDEPSAAALGYGLSLHPGQVYLVFDFGGGSLDVSVIQLGESADARGRHCRVLGKAGRDLGGARIDQWLFQEILRFNNRSEEESAVREHSTQLLVYSEYIKERLSFEKEASLDALSLSDGSVLSFRITREDFEHLLDAHGLFTDIHRTIQLALNQARERGYDEDQIQAVLMIGGSSRIPAVQRLLRQWFGRERVLLHRPLEAVALGTAAFIGGVELFDYIQHDYAIRYIDPQRGKYDYRVIVPRGTPYPTPEPVARLTIKAAYEGQQRLGLAIFEIGDSRPRTEESVEIIFDPGGAVRLLPLSPQEQEARTLFWMNENNPTFLVADPPASQGEPRFEVEFFVDAQKRLVINARDLLHHHRVLNAVPVVRLT
ncbi:Hsp70 family protein [Thermanaerothrix sp. 4228-RoL]|jgi:molecular chaperone DnaK (HSP70)|uniref:Hsp70 family protein n=1 Tax=Thermanaerothrix solaris TaxID=3058434 RepID=A0ABU3NL39_9CHLR|nr:Hsp70 family protein [Thermanaerothrix sp. 4228-RoL]MDT8897534.1 Hsp70 family protein [Thermanaerothrix sp. 4228-RoL]